MKPSVKTTRDLMGMTINVEIVDFFGANADIESVFAYFENVENRFSFFKKDSETTLINSGKITRGQYSNDMQAIFDLAEITKIKTGGYFDIMTPEGKYNPSGLVKGWAILNAAGQLLKKGYRDFYVEAGGDIQAHGYNRYGKKWSVGIQNPHAPSQIVKVVYLHDEGIATSGTYRRGQHIYDPHLKGKLITDILSISVIGTDVLEADRFATAAFAMGKSGLDFIESLDSLEAFMIDCNGISFQTSGFVKYLQEI